MGKRFAIISIILLVAGVILIGYFLNQSRKNLFTDPYKVINSDAAIVIETIDLRDFINSLAAGKGFASEIETVKEFNNFSSKLKFIADQVNKTGFKKILQESTAVISFHPAGNGKLKPFLAKIIPGEIRFRQLKEALISSGIKDLVNLRIAGKQIIGLPYSLNDSRDTVFVTINSGLLICSTSFTLINKAVIQSSHEADIRKIPGFTRIQKSAGEKEDKIFIVFGNLGKSISKIFSDAEFSVVAKIPRLGVCGGGDIVLNENGLDISGYSESNDPSEILYRYKSLSSVTFQTYKVLPSETSLFESLAVNPEKLSKPSGTGNTDQITEFAVKLRPFLGHEITKAYIDIKNNPPDQNSLVIYEISNRDQCENILTGCFGDKITIAYFRPDEQTRIPIYIPGQKGLLSAILPDFAPGFNDSAFAFYDNYMITGNSYVTISRFLYDNLLNKTLANDMLYRDFEKLVPSRAGFLFYCVPSHCIDYLSQYLRPETAAALRSNKNSLDKIQSVGFQLASINDMIYNSLSVSYKDVIREESKTEWETLLDTTAGIKPFFFTNHNTGAREIFVQDIKNNAYLINAAGRVLWKVPLREKINGSVFMIDYYRNGKYQLLFSGKNYLHLLDRNGNYVERYPVRLRSPATNSVALFDYENNNTYRLVIAGEDKRVYAYDKSGSSVKGWEPFRSAGFVSTEASFYKVSGKDYIIVADESSIYFLDRSGKTRLKLNDAVTKAQGSALRLTPGSEPSLVCTSPDGTIQHIYFNGDVKKFPLRRFSFDHLFDFFDVDGDGFGEYVFIDKGILYLYDNNRSEMFTKDFGSEKLGGPISFVFSSNDRKIGVFDIEKNLIYLVSSKGEIMKGFPLKGASMFSIGKLSAGEDWNLIVGGTDRFMYNYKLDTSAK